MGPKIKKVERTSQATPFAEDFLELMKGYIAGLKTPVPGPMQQGGVGNAPGQYDNSLSRLIGGVNTAGIIGNQTDPLINAVTAKSNLITDRNAAQTRESFGLAGNRLGTPLAMAEGRVRNEGAIDLETLISQILTDQIDREQAARQFDVAANQQAMLPFLQLASQGILPEEIIASPSVGQQLLGGAIDLGAAYLTGGGSLLPKLFGAGAKAFGGSGANGMPGFNPGTLPQFGGNRRPATSPIPSPGMTLFRPNFGGQY